MPKTNKDLKCARPETYWFPNGQTEYGKDIEIATTKRYKI